MRELQANTEVKVVIGPFVDVTDGYTPETGITLGAADEAELMKHDAASVTDISSNTWAAITSMDGYYNLTLTATDTNTEGMMVIAIQDDSVCLPVRAEFMVLAQAAYTSKYTAKDTGYMDINVKAVSEDTTAADNIEADYDGTGYNKSASTIGTCTTNTDMRGTDSALLAASAPANFGDLAITATTGQTTVGTNNDKAGYSISGTLTTLDALDTQQDAQHAATQADIAALNDLSAADVNAEVDTALTDYDGPTKTEMDAAFTEIKGATWSDTTDTLEDIRDAVDTKASQSSVDTVDGNVDSILEDTGTTLPASLTTIEGKIDTVDGNVDAILVDTGTTLPATLTTIEGKIDTVDTNVDSVLEDTGTTLPATLTTIEGKVDTVDTNVDAVLVDTQRVDGLIEDSGGDRFTTKALEQAAAGSGLSAQEVRDAMKLAPTVGAPAAGSVDEALDDIYTDTQRVDGLIEDDSGDQYTAKALSQAPGGAVATDVNVVSVGGTAVTSPSDLRAKATISL